MAAFRTPLLVLAVLGALTGCAQVKSMVAKTSSRLGIGAVSPAEVKTAIETEDYPKLQDLCLEKIAIDSNVANHHGDACAAAIKLAGQKDDAAFLKPLCTRRKEHFGAHYAPACPTMLDLALRTGDEAHVKTMCEQDKYEEACRVLESQATFADLEAPDCSTFADRVRAAREGLLQSSKTPPDEMSRYVVALARCGEAKMIFEELAHVGDFGPGGYGVKVLVAAEKQDGAALFAAYEKYTKENTGAAFLGAEHGDFAADHIGHWLLATGHQGECKRLVSSANGAKEPVVNGLLRYFQETGCNEGAALAVKLLASDNPGRRADGCRALAKIGDKSHLKKLTILADTDTSHVVREEPRGSGVYVKDYFVADACRQAIGKIQLRE